MYCRHCGESVDPNQAICVKCGVKVGDGTNFCANCGKTINAAADVCLECGYAVKKPDKSNDDNKLMLGIMALLFGGIGIHNFIMGETKKGIMKIILCWTGISLILALIDAVKIFTDKYEINTDKYF